MKQENLENLDFLHFTRLDVRAVCFLFESAAEHFVPQEGDTHFGDPSYTAFCDRIQKCAYFLIRALDDVGLDLIIEAYLSNHPDKFIHVDD